MKIKSKSGAVLGALIAAALVSASAASLGGLTSPTLGAESEVVAGCDSDGIEIAYGTTYNVTSQDYEVDEVRLLNVDAACLNQLASVTLDDDGTVGGILTDESELIVTFSDQDSDTVSDDFLITITTPVNAALVQNIALVIA